MTTRKTKQEQKSQYTASIKFPCTRAEYAARVAAKAKELDTPIGELTLRLFDQLDPKKPHGK